VILAKAGCGVILQIFKVRTGLRIVIKAAY
jgi:hypothetical protein